jgi:hypothetical protein
MVLLRSCRLSEEIMSDLEHGLRWTDRVDVQIAEDLRANGWLVYVLPGGVDGKGLFFAAVKAVLPLNPPVKGNEKWDALSDSLFGGLDEIEAKKIAVIWPDAALMAARDPQEFATAISVLSDVATSLGDPEVTGGQVRKVAVVIPSPS